MRALRAIFATDHELVVEKPSGIPSEPTYRKDGNSALEKVRRGEFDCEGLSAAARDRLPDAVLPHRIDALTEGLLVIALSTEAAGWHGKEIAARRWRKLYIAALPGTVRPDELLGVHKAYLIRRGRRAERVRAGGKPAFMEILAAERSSIDSDVVHALIDLKTGRYHQIRVMLEGLGCPLVGDGFYGGREGDMLLRHVLVGFRPFGAELVYSLVSLEGLEERGVSQRILELVRATQKRIHGRELIECSAQGG
jgi:23S rRNA-/tRNA-specific pseudouridylate synthase